MAKKAQSTSTVHGKNVRKKRKGMHSKKRSSKLKSSKNYTKKYKGQGK